MNERIIELHDIAPKEFWGTQDSHLETIKKYYPRLKIVARGNKIKAYGDQEVLEEFDKRQDPSGKDYYWLTGHFAPFEEHQEDTDLFALRNGYVSIVPVSYDLTNYTTLEEISSWID